MKVKTHLIVTGQWDEFKIKWVKRICDTKPKFDSYGYPTFVVVGGAGRVEMKTFDIREVEEQAKKATHPRGRGSLTSDRAYIFIKEEKEEALLGYVMHDHIRQYARCLMNFEEEVK